jgi:hypothetical protein
MIRRMAAALALIAAACLAACGSLTPFATAPKAAKPVRSGQPATAPRVAICYNGWETSRAEAQAQAQQQCAKGTVAQPVAADDYLQVCPVMLPTHATYACITAAK